jgi:very-long-chain enoyl-CoA reductase
MLPSLPIHVPTDAASLAIAAFQSLNLLAAANEIKNPTPYSKFARGFAGAKLPSRLGMLSIYTPSAVISGISLLTSLTSGLASERTVLVAAMLFVHFAKRVAETLLLHRFSGSMVGGTAAFISIFYSLVTCLVLVQQGRVPLSVYDAASSSGILSAGLILFAVGQLGNFYHHWLLASLRKPEASASADGAAEKAYVVPRGGLFELVTMPHYLFEIVAWFGIALAAQQLNVLLVVAGMTSYLAGRSVATSRWYESKFGDKFPGQRRHMVPFIF